MNKEDFDRIYKTAHPDLYAVLKDNAHNNRIAPTDAENFLWQHIRRKALGVRFRRQHTIGDYIVDFVCLNLKLVIEVDGGYHFTEEQRRLDEIRSNYLYKCGFYVLRFTNEAILMDIDASLEKIKELINKLNI